MTLYNDPDMTPDEIASELARGKLWGGWPCRHDEYSEALGHHAAGIMLAGRPTHYNLAGLGITDLLWPLPKLQWDALHIYRILPRVFRMYDMDYTLDSGGHVMFAGDLTQYRIYFRVWSLEVADRFSEAYLIPDERVNLRL